MRLPFLALPIPIITATLSNPVDSTGALSTSDLSAAMVVSHSVDSPVHLPSVALANGIP
jgi:hypothetical protein